jgi:hypothetical protein
MKRLILVALTLLLAASSAFASDASERRFIREGMSEGEILVKIGKPDSESLTSGMGATVIEKQWIYLPTPDDPQVVTTIILRAGTAISVRRQVSHY